MVNISKLGFLFKWIFPRRFAHPVYRSEFVKYARFSSNLFNLNRYSRRYCVKFRCDDHVISNDLETSYPWCIFPLTQFSPVLRLDIGNAIMLL